MREFKSGATRDDDTDKYDYEGFLSPLVLERYAEYMHKHRKQADGKLRDSDNWQKGIPVVQYMKSKIRHIVETWKLHRFELALEDYSPVSYQEEIEESLCAELFNTMGMLDVILKGQTNEKEPKKTKLETA
jgi:hypothetical protein